MKYLLITSDDFGMTLSVNRGIEGAILGGLVGATNVMVPCPWSSDAIRRIKEHALPAGIHLTLTCEWDFYRWRPLTASAALRAADGCMHSTFAAIPDALSPGEIRAEFDAQLAELRRGGVEPTHVDTHMIASASSSPTEQKVKAVVRDLCAEEGLIYTYDTQEDGAFRHFDSETMFSPMSVDELKSRLAVLGDGVHHVISHCAVDGDDLSALCSEGSGGRPWARDYRVKDFATLTSAEFRAFVAGEGFTLLNMHDFLKLS